MVAFMCIEDERGDAENVTSEIILFIIGLFCYELYI